MFVNGYLSFVKRRVSTISGHHTSGNGVTGMTSGMGIHLQQRYKPSIQTLYKLTF